MSIAQEFKTFAMRGNVVDLAVGVVIGAAFGRIVSSLVGDIITPILGLITGGADFSELAIVLREAQGEETPAILLAYGRLIQAILDFIIVAWVIFWVVRAMNAAKHKEEAVAEVPPAPVETPVEQKLLTEIRDLLKAQQR